MVNVTVKKTAKNRNAILERVQKLAKVGVLVGIPQEKSSRKPESSAPNTINNAELLYIHTHGIRNNKMIREMSNTMSNNNSYSSAYDLYIQSHGSPLMNTPPRPVIEPAIEANIEPINDMMKSAMKSYLMTESTDGLRKVGMFASAQCKNWFEDSRNNWASNSPFTIKKKKSSSPLIDTGAMRQAITYVVDMGGGDD